MTDNEHRIIGEILGFPSCCVEEWIAYPQGRTGKGAGIERGVIVGHARSFHEVERLRQQISRAIGWDWYGLDGDTVKRYVPCSKHMYTEGWKP